MDFRLTVRTYTGAIKTVEVLDMPSEEAARAEAVAMTFGRVQSVERLDKDKPKPTTKRKERVQSIEKQLKPGETETIITGYNNNPLAIFSSLLDIW